MMLWKDKRYQRLCKLGLLVLVLSIAGIIVWRNVLVRTYFNVMQNTLSLEKLTALPKLQVGDIVLRFGVGADSYAIAQISNSQYSHCGIISAVSPEIMITHASTLDDLSSKFDGVTTVPLQSFLEQATAIAIVRYVTLTPDLYPQLKAFLNQQTGRKFSLDVEATPLNIETSQSERGVYCTTLIEQALSPLIELTLSRQQIDTPLAQGSFLFPEAFLHDPNAQLIYVFPHVTPQASSHASSSNN